MDKQPTTPSGMGISPVWVDESHSPPSERSTSPNQLLQLGRLFLMTVLLIRLHCPLFQVILLLLEQMG